MAHSNLEDFINEAKQFIENPIGYKIKKDVFYIGGKSCFITVTDGSSGTFDVVLGYCVSDDTIAVYGSFDTKDYKREQIIQAITKLRLSGL